MREDLFVMKNIYDICIIGAGAGGLSIASVSAQLGLKVCLIENHKMGGDCLNYGCIPSKSILAAAKAAKSLKKMPGLGIHIDGVSIDYQKVHQHIHQVIKTIEPHDSVERFESLGVTVKMGNATFINKNTVLLDKEHISAKHFVIATGSRAFIPRISGLKDVEYLTNETIFDLKEIPKHLIAIGGGPIGCELSQAIRLLGAEVSILQRSHLLPHDDADLTSIVKDELIKDGVSLYEHTSEVHSVSKTPDGEICVTFTQDDQTKSITGSHLLIATGRQVNARNLGLEKAGIEYTPKGIQVNAKLKTSNKRIYAVGDVTGGFQFTHIAGYHAGIVIQNMLFKKPAKVNYKAIPWVTYTSPELAHVGVSHEQASKEYPKGKTITVDFSELDRAQTEKQTLGKLKATFDHKGNPVSVSIVGQNAGELIYPWIIAIDNHLSIGKLSKFIAPYPTWGELTKKVVSKYYEPILYANRTKKLVRFLSHL
jgi:pyruvate/2-oxoglutarate dehydrogenase complex dihydrolipoamide dehydrogenase (E3) component